MCVSLSLPPSCVCACALSLCMCSRTLGAFWHVVFTCISLSRMRALSICVRVGELRVLSGIWWIYVYLHTHLSRARSRAHTLACGVNTCSSLARARAHVRALSVCVRVGELRVLSGMWCVYMCICLSCARSCVHTHSLSACWQTMGLSLVCGVYMCVSLALSSFLSVCVGKLRLSRLFSRMEWLRSVGSIKL